jgi:hypothetical protein
MRLSASLIFLFELCVVLLLAYPAAAGPLFPCPKAVSSSNGNFMVLTDVQSDHGPGNTVKVRRVSFQVFPREKFINDKNRLVTPATYWTDWPRWEVVLDSVPMHSEPECPLAVIADNGEFLILLRVGMVLFSSDAVLQIYRWDHQYSAQKPQEHSIFVKDINLKEIWPPDKVAANTGFWTDETPEWFAGGTFDFSPDCRQLIHKTRWGNTVSIKLEDGSVLWK